ncbi:MAG: hypothetical protein NT049_03820, partial [Planctomycetota bacterium]|nr:hypothetical protein [Planctomycetota bacterium]
VSGAMNGRMLWWQDGYDQFEQAGLARHYHEAAAAAAEFVRGVDFTGFTPVPCVLADGLKGAVIGNDKMRLGWFRDVRCDPPDWPMKPVTGQTVTVDAPGDSWHAEFFDPATGKPSGENRVSAADGRLRITVPEFQGSIAVRLRRVEP